MKSKLLNTKKAALVAAAPLLLAEADLNAAIIYHDTPVTLGDGSSWAFPLRSASSISGNTIRSVRQYFLNASSEGAGLYASYGAGTLNFEKSGDDAVSIAFGQTIGNKLSFDDFAEFPANSGSAFYGFAVGGENYFGWAEISTNVGVGDTRELTIHRWAIEDTAGQSIVAGAIPEPSDFALGLGGLALGAAAVMRKRRKEQADSDKVA